MQTEMFALFFCIFHLAKAPPGFIIELVPRCARARCLEAEKEKRDYEINHQNPDGRPAGQADFAGQPAAGPVQPAAGTVQHVGRGRRGPVCRVHGTGCRGLHQHSGHPVHRFPYRPEQRHQRAGGTLLRGPAHRRCAKDGALGRHRQPDRRCGAAVHRPAGFALHAAAAQHQGRPAARCHPVPAGVFSGHAGAGTVQLRQCGVQLHRRHQKAPDLSVPCGRAEHRAEPVLRHRLPPERGGRGAGQCHLPVRLGRADPAGTDPRTGLLRAGCTPAAPGPCHDKAHSEPGPARRVPERHFCHCQPVHPGRRQLL